MLTTAFPKITVGLDVGDRQSRTCEIDASAQVVREAVVSTTTAAIAGYFAEREPCRVVLEAGTHSPWISRQIERLGHEVIVGNPARMYPHKRRKNDRRDASFMARQGRADPELLCPIRHRSAHAQEHLELLRARNQVVSVRTKLINHVRSAVKTAGARVGSSSAESFALRARSQIPPELRGALQPILSMILGTNEQIDALDREVSQVAREYPELSRLQQIPGVGELTSLAFVLLVEDPSRFERSRDVGPFFGLVPRLDQSSDSSPQLRISKAGDVMGRRLLISAAHYILGPHGRPCDLRRYGEAIAARGGTNAKKRAVVAVARKLSVLLHKLWVSGATYDPDRQLKRQV